MAKKKYYSYRKTTAPTGLMHGNNRALRRIASGVIGLTLILAVASLVTANTLGTFGGESRDLNRDVAELQIENESLKVDLANLTSATRIYKEALALGFVSPHQLEQVKATKPVALR
jgi:hypothetical protein